MNRQIELDGYFLAVADLALGSFLNFSGKTKLKEDFNYDRLKRAYIKNIRSGDAIY